MTRKQEKIAEKILKELQRHKLGVMSPREMRAIIEPFYGSEDKEMPAESLLIFRSLIDEYSFVRLEGKSYALTSAGRRFRSFSKERRRSKSEFVRKRVSFWISIIAIIIAIATFYLNITSKANSKDQIEKLKNRIEKLENYSTSSDTERAPMRQETDSIFKPLETQQNQDIQEK